MLRIIKTHRAGEKSIQVFREAAAILLGEAER